MHPSARSNSPASREHLPTSSYTPVELNDLHNEFERISSAKVLGTIIRDDIRWNDHISSIKDSKTFVSLKTVKKSWNLLQGLDSFLSIAALLDNPVSCSKAVLVIHYLSDELERIQGALCA